MVVLNQRMSAAEEPLVLDGDLASDPPRGMLDRENNSQFLLNLQKCGLVARGDESWRSGAMASELFVVHGILPLSLLRSSSLTDTEDQRDFLPSFKTAFLGKLPPFSSRKL